MCTTDYSGRMIVTKHGHACLVIEQEGSTLVLDPGSFTPAFDVDALVGVVVTHEHADHVTPEHLDRLLQAGPLPLFAPAGVAAALPQYDWQVVEPGEVRTVGPFELEFTGGRHAVIHRSIPVIDNLAVTINGMLFHPGDSFTVPPREVELVAVPSSAPWLKIGDVMDWLEIVRPKRAFPIHELVNSERGQAMANARITSVVEAHGGTVTVLNPGESIEVG